ncbi:uncharacterized protein JCM6883_004579 [Sporobolomyces salmoneus]|uniref:uncharacterized protein n=1 Tax=Sporobolomyces salmoneus TaxID=183962 RepID=UPI003172653B
MSTTLVHSGSKTSTTSSSNELIASPSVEKPEEFNLTRSELADVYEQSRKERLSSIFTIICSGFALISDGLQNNIMTLTNVVFAQLYGAKLYTPAYSTQVSNALTVGTILGQVAIGLLCDYRGRKWGIVLSTVCIVVGVILATGAHGSGDNLQRNFTGFIWFLTVARGLTGIGVGGEYPSSSASSLESANERMQKQRGPVFIMVTNFVLSFGGVFASSLYLIVFQAAGGLNANLSTVWRTVFGITAVPPLVVFIFRLRMLNSQLYRKGAIQSRVPYGLVLRYYWKSLIGTCGVWFLYDFIVFPNGVFSGAVIANIVKETGKEKIRKTAEWQLLLSTIALPGCIVGALLVNRLGRRNLMILGFAGYLAIGLIVGIAYPQLSKPSNVGVFIFLYGMLACFGNLGPGNTLGLTSAESYATAVRGTCYGLSAAIGKVGAVVGVETFNPIKIHLGQRYTFVVAACCGLLGIVVAYFFIRNDLDGDLADEDEKFAAYLRANGWQGSIGASQQEGLEVMEAAENETVKR